MVKRRWEKFLDRLPRDVVEEKQRADLTSAKPPASLEHYGFNEWGTWGYCSFCRFEVTLGEDGFMLEHKHRYGSAWDSADCPGNNSRPSRQPAFEVPV